MRLFDFLSKNSRGSDQPRRQQRNVGKITVALHGQRASGHRKQLQQVAPSPSIHTSQRLARSFASRHVIPYYSTKLCMYLYSVNLA